MSPALVLVLLLIALAFAALGYALGAKRTRASGGQSLPTSEGAAQELETLRARVQHLEAVARELESFSYTVSHDLRAPLRVIDGFARILREDFGPRLDQVGEDHLGRIQAAAARMNGMIDALLRLSKMSAEPLRPEAIDLAVMAREIARELEWQDPLRTVQFELPTSLPVHADPVLMRVVLENLLGNAWKYSGRRAEARIALTASPQEGGSLVYCVSDNGAGFDMRFADRLFQVFKRLHGASDFPGTGVGLATVARIIERHQGRVWAQSEPGQGARFYFTLGRSAPENASSRSVASSTSDTAASSSTPR